MSSPTPTVALAAAYRQLALTVLSLDVPTLTADLRAKRVGKGCPTPLATPAAQRAA